MCNHTEAVNWELTDNAMVENGQEEKQWWTIHIWETTFWAT